VNSDPTKQKRKGWHKPSNLLLPWPLKAAPTRLKRKGQQKKRKPEWKGSLENIEEVAAYHWEGEEEERGIGLSTRIGFSLDKIKKELGSQKNDRG